MKRIAYVLFGILLGAGITVLGQKESDTASPASGLRKVPPEKLPLAMRPLLTDASEISIGEFLVVHGGPENQRTLAVFPRRGDRPESEAHFPVLVATVDRKKGSFTVNMQDSRGHILSMRDANGDGAADGYEVTLVSGARRITYIDRTMDGLWDLQMEEKLDGANWTAVQTRIRYKDEWLSYLLIDGKPAVRTKEGIRRIEVKDGVVELMNL